MATRTLRIELEAITSKLTGGFDKAGQASKKLTRDLDATKAASLDVREATVKVEKAQVSAARATKLYGADSLKAAEATVRLERAQQTAKTAADRQAASTAHLARETGHA